MSASVPEPTPVKNGDEVTPLLISYIETVYPQEHNQHLISLIMQRHQFGMEKYGQPLMTKDGRNGIEDARQELGDLIQYIFKTWVSGEHHTQEEIDDFRKLWRLSKDLIDSIIEN